MHWLGLTSCPLRKRVISSNFNLTIKPCAVLQLTISLCKKFQILTVLKAKKYFRISSLAWYLFNLYLLPLVIYKI